MTRKSSIEAVALGFESTITLATTGAVESSANWTNNTSLFSFTNAPYILPYTIIYLDHAAV